MSGANYAGNPASFPTQFPLLSDSSTASDINVPIEALADRTAYLKGDTDKFHTALDKARYLNWPTGVSLTALTQPFSTPVPCAYDPMNCCLVLAGAAAGSGNPGIYLVTDGGTMGVSSQNLLGAVGDSTLFPISVACDDVGNVVVTTFSRYVWEFSGANFVVNKRDVVGAAATYGATASIYSPSAGKWLFVAASTASSVPVSYSSAARVTWTAGNVTFSSGAVYSSLDLAINPAGTVLLAALTGTTVRLARTSNVGGTWSTETSITSSVASASTAQVSWDATRSIWLLVVASILPASGSELWTSPDGITWTKKITFTKATLGKVAVDEFGAYVSCFSGNATNRGVGPAFSLDGGATWQRVGIQPPLDGGGGLVLSRCFFTGSGFVAVTATGVGLKSMFSLRTGNPSLSAVT